MFNSGLDPNKASVTMPLNVVTVEHQYDPATHAKDFTYKQDAAYFAARKGRYLAIRKAAIREFFNPEATLWNDGKAITPPQAWVRVTRIPNLGHSAVVVWLGDLPGEECDQYGYLMNCNSDEVVNVYVKKMKQMGCANWIEVIAYQNHLEQAKAIYNAQHTAIGSNRKAN